MKNTKATKILLSNIDSQWGVVVNQHSANEYRHIVHFPSEEKKTEFINEKLFKGQNYKELLKNSPSRSFKMISAMDAEISVNIHEEPNESIADLLNKDFAIVEEDGKTMFYAITGVRKGQIIIYQCSLDVFFTYNVTDIFNDNLINVKRAMYDRWDLSGVHPLPSFDKLSPLFTSEPVEDGINEESLIPSYSTEILEYDYTEFMRDSVLANKNEINKKLNELKFEVVHFASGFEVDAATNHTTNSKYDNIDVPYKTFTWPSTRNGIKIILNTTLENHGKISPLIDLSLLKEDNLKEILANAKTMKLTRTSSFNSLLPQLCENAKKIMGGTNKYEWQTRIAIDKWTHPDGSFDYVFLIKIDGAENQDNHTYHISPNADFHPELFNVSYWQRTASKIVDGNTQKATGAFFIRNYQPLDSLPIYKSSQKPIIDVETQHHRISEIVENVHSQEFKAFLSPYRRYEIKFASANRLKLSPQLWDHNDNIEIQLFYGYLIEKNAYVINIPKYDNQYQYSTVNDHRYENKFYIMETNQFIPDEINAWNEYIVQNKNQLDASKLKNKVGLASGILGAFAGIVKGDIKGVVGGISIAGHSALSINQQNAQIKDIKNTPSQVANATSSFLLDSFIRKQQPKLTEYQLPKENHLLVKEFFYKYGYNYANKLMNINHVLDTRYYFNYVEAEDVLENIKINLAPSVKQAIDDAFTQGITIWHYRDKNTFKGIKNYKYQNLELSYMKKLGDI